MPSKLKTQLIFTNPLHIQQNLFQRRQVVLIFFLFIKCVYVNVRVSTLHEKHVGIFCVRIFQIFTRDTHVGATAYDELLLRLMIQQENDRPFTRVHTSLLFPPPQPTYVAAPCWLKSKITSASIGSTGHFKFANLILSFECVCFISFHQNT